MATVHTQCELLRAEVNRAEKEIDYWVNKLALESGGYSPQTMPMIWLRSSAMKLHELAAKVEAMREALITDEKEVIK